MGNYMSAGRVPAFFVSVIISAHGLAILARYIIGRAARFWSSDSESVRSRYL